MARPAGIRCLDLRPAAEQELSVAQASGSTQQRDRPGDGALLDVRDLVTHFRVRYEGRHLRHRRDPEDCPRRGRGQPYHPTGRDAGPGGRKRLRQIDPRVHHPAAGARHRRRGLLRWPKSDPFEGQGASTVSAQDADHIPGPVLGAGPKDDDRAGGWRAPAGAPDRAQGRG